MGAAVIFLLLAVFILCMMLRLTAAFLDFRDLGLSHRYMREQRLKGHAYDTNQ